MGLTNKTLRNVRRRSFYWSFMRSLPLAFSAISIGPRYAWTHSCRASDSAGPTWSLQVAVALSSSSFIIMAVHPTFFNATPLASS